MNSVPRPLGQSSCISISEYPDRYTRGFHKFKVIEINTTLSHKLSNNCTLPWTSVQWATRSNQMRKPFCKMTKGSCVLSSRQCSTPILRRGKLGFHPLAFHVMFRCPGILLVFSLPLWGPPSTRPPLPMWEKYDAICYRKITVLQHVQIIKAQDFLCQSPHYTNINTSTTK